MSLWSLTIMVNIVSTICHNCKELKRCYVPYNIPKLYFVKIVFRTLIVEITMIK